MGFAMTAVDQTDSFMSVKTRLPPGVDNSAPAPTATFLGLFSVGLGLTELLCPHDTARATGVKYPQLLRGYGIRELIAGIGILSTTRPAFWLWSRVAGDAVDLATIAAAYKEAGARDRQRLLASALAVAGVTDLDVACAAEHSCMENEAPV
jgi:hypothetical protein